MTLTLATCAAGPSHMLLLLLLLLNVGPDPRGQMPTAGVGILRTVGD